MDANNSRLDPRGIKPSDTDGDTLQTIGGKAAWGPAPTGTGTGGGRALVPVTSQVDGELAFAITPDFQLILVEVPL